MLAIEHGRTPATLSNDRFEALFAAEYPRVVAIARKVLLDGHLAEDVAQDVFASFLRGSKAIQPGHSARWLHAAAVHSALNVLRSNRRRGQRELKEAQALHALGRARDESQDPQHIVETRERRAQVRAVLRRLAPRYATVLVLRHAGLSY